VRTQAPILAAFVLCLASLVFALDFPPLTGRVVDQANIMTAQMIWTLPILTMKSLFRDDNAARQSNCRAEITSMAFSIFAMVSGTSRCWYAVMQAGQQNCICQ
jgi:hypothetical protein